MDPGYLIGFRFNMSSPVRNSGPAVKIVGISPPTNFFLFITNRSETTVFPGTIPSINSEYSDYKELTRISSIRR